MLEIKNHTYFETGLAPAMGKDGLEYAVFVIKGTFGISVGGAEAVLAEAQAAPETTQDLVAQAEAGVLAAQAQVKVAEGQLTHAQAGLDRLLAGATEEEIEMLQAQVASAETNQEIAQLRLDQAMIIAPMDGRVANVLINTGEQAAPGAPALNIVNEGAFHIEVMVDEIDIDQIAVGQEVDITLDALPDTIVTGEIAEIAPTAATSSPI